MTPESALAGVRDPPSCAVLCLPNIHRNSLGRNRNMMKSPTVVRSGGSQRREAAGLAEQLVDRMRMALQPKPRFLGSDPASYRRSTFDRMGPERDTTAGLGRDRG